MAPDPSQELSDLDQKLVDATSRFDRMPGAMWLAATAIIESATRMGDALPTALDERRQELLVRARRARDDAGPRSSENDVSAITAWVELAEKRAALERVLKSALGEIEAHRVAHPVLGDAITSRKALERALNVREKDVTEREARLAVALDEIEKDELALLAERGQIPPSDDGTSDTDVLARSAAARARLAAGPGGWHSSVIFGATIVAIFASPWVSSELVRQILMGAVVAGLVGGFLMRERARSARQQDLWQAHAMRRRDEARSAAAKEDHARLIRVARALGALDAFGATDDGRTLEDRESKLVALAPWIRELVSGFTTEEAKRFE